MQPKNVRRLALASNIDKACHQYCVDVLPAVVQNIGRIFISYASTG